MSEEKKKKTENTDIKDPGPEKNAKTDSSYGSDNPRTVTVTSDDKNAVSANALPGSRGSADAADKDLNADDDILAVIRRRKAAEEKKTRALEIAEISGIADAEVDDFFAMEGLDRELSAPEKKGADTKVVDRATFNESIKNAEKDPKRTITVDKPADERSGDKTVSKTEPEASAHKDVDISDYFYPETKPSDKKSDKEKDSKLQDAAADTESEKEKEKDKDKDKEKDTDALLQELINEEIGAKKSSESSEAEADSGESDQSENEKRYGFKPYTREIRSLELAAAAEAEAEKQANSFSGKIKRMATKRKKTSSGAKSSGAKSSGSAAKGKSKAARNSKTLANVKMSRNTTAFKLSEYNSRNAKKSGGSKKKPRKKRKKWVGFVRAFIRTFIIFALIGCIAGAGYTAYVVSHAPTIHPKNIYDTLDVSSHIYDDKENLVDEIYFSENRELATYDQLPENLKNAFIAVEDKTFWTHSGFNFRRIIGAILERFHGGRISGTSTITQQLARNVFLPEDKSVRSIKRKIIEMYYAYQIEQELSKEEIITAYLNTIYLGYGCYGVDTAANTYFSTDVEGLTLEQCAALAALPQAPGTYSLLTNEPTDSTVEYAKGIYINDASADRRNMILNLMLQQGMITQEEKDAATRPLVDFIKPGSRSTASSTSAFKDYLIETIKKDLMNEYGIDEEQAVKIIYTKGLNIYTTLDSQAQEVITEQFKKKKNFPNVTKGDGEVEAAMVITEVGTGKIKAMVGTRKVTGQMLFNRATNPRQPGSSIKPLAVYAPALQRSLEYQEEGKIFKFKDKLDGKTYDKQGSDLWGDYLTVSSTVLDEPMKIEGRTWPKNVTRTYSGKNTFRTAIQKSINTCAVKILIQIGVDYSMDTLQRFGITSVVADTSQPVNDLNLAALGLGAMTYGISPLEMSAAYATFPNGGVRNTTICYTKVEDSGGRTLLESKSETVRVLDKGVAWIMTNVLQSVVTRGIATPAKVDGIEVGGKTGTTDDKFDIWFCGFTPTISAALWIGTDDNVQMDSMSEKASALWGKIIGKVDIARGGKYKKMPKNVIRAWDGEYYTKGTEPEEPPPPPEPEPEEEKPAEGTPAAPAPGDPAAPAPAAPAPAAPAPAEEPQPVG